VLRKIVGPQKEKIQKGGENSLMRNFILCTVHLISPNPLILLKRFSLSVSVAESQFHIRVYYHDFIIFTELKDRIYM
jgi:hypothetical protein